jgi:hypothetical protein
MVAKFIFELNGSSQAKKSIKIVHIRCGQQHPMTYINHANRPASRSDRFSFHTNSKSNFKLKTSQFSVKSAGTGFAIPGGQQCPVIYINPFSENVYTTVNKTSLKCWNGSTV